jgi:type I restriction-modification system DNA methylase subunit
MATEETPRIAVPDEARAAIAARVERFRDHAHELRSEDYNERSVCADYIEPFFCALGWDVYNEKPKAEIYRDVIHQYSIPAPGGRKAPDYCFTIAGQRKFLVEAKKPFVRVKDDPGPAYQLRRYAWSAKLPVCILTNFEELAVYNCSSRPSQGHHASVDRVAYMTFDQYDDRLEWLYSLFSLTAIERGYFDRYTKGAQGKRGTSEVDDEFLREIEAWRDTLARDIARRNLSLSGHELNACVQALVDRILFLRIAEDRGVEPYQQLRDLAGQTATYEGLWERFAAAEQKYDSGLFDFAAEGDVLARGLQVSDKALKPILGGLYYPESPYEFSAISADILGAVYERFLGKVIRLTAGHQAKVEDKPEVRKAGGVYYTPKYIVDYIVEHTLGDLLGEWEGAQPGENTGRKSRGSKTQDGTPDGGRQPAARRDPPVLSVLDPACGSGSFLLGAYQCLLDWHLRHYTEGDPKRWSRGKSARTAQRGNGEWRLTLAERKRILTESIFGVDIDRQAVEVTKLNLLLKCLEGETEQTVGAQFRLFHERVLPNIDANIRCGNSLIGPDYWDGKQTVLFDDEEARRVNPFDWEREFAGIRGGFDCVIGNPPYIRIQSLSAWSPETPPYVRRHYESAGAGSCDIYVAFVERGLSLLSGHGYLGYILPNKFMRTDYGHNLRRHLARRQALRLMVDFGAGQVFANATTYTCLLFLSGAPTSSPGYLRQASPGDIAGNVAQPADVVVPRDGSPWEFGSPASSALVARVAGTGTPLAQWPCAISRGSSTGADDVFMLRQHDGVLLSRAGLEVEVEGDILRTPIYATDFGRYCFRPQASERVVFPYRVAHDSYSVIPEGEMQSAYPLAYAYLSAQKRVLAARKSSGPWYAFSAPRNLAVHESADLVVPLLANRGAFAPLQPAGRFCLMASGGFSLTIGRGPHDMRYVLAVLNSSVAFWLLHQISNVFRGGWVTCTKQYVSRLPIRTIDFSDPSDVAKHDTMVSLVETMLDLHRRLADAKTAADRDLVERRISAIDRQIDLLVYGLYELTDEEVAIVEGGA